MFQMNIVNSNMLPSAVMAKSAKGGPRVDRRPDARDQQVDLVALVDLAMGENPLVAYQQVVDKAISPPKPRKTTPKAKATRPVGRPPGGLNGERVRDYQRVTLWLPPQTKQQLEALARFRGLPSWRVVGEALTAMEQALPEDERKALKIVREQR
jgi:hypothetical protein